MAYIVNNNFLNFDSTTIYNDDCDNNSEIIIINNENFNSLIASMKNNNPLKIDLY